MTDQEQNIAVAEAMGVMRWTILEKRYPDCADYGSDLNACHKMECFLTGSQYEDWCGYLSEAFCANKDLDPALGIYSASAPQRREAFLRALDLYHE